MRLELPNVIDIDPLKEQWAINIRTGDYNAEGDTTETICVIITDEGLIIDFYENGHLISTIGNTFAEWYERADYLGEPD
jgi:hypothetical protein